MDAAREWLAALIAVLFGIVPSSPVITAIAKPLPQLPPKHATILFGGDMMFDRGVRDMAKKKGGDYLFSCLDDLFSKPDLIVANLEGPITGNKSVSVGTAPSDLDNFTFTFPTSTGELLYRHNVKLVNLGNNHILNFKWKGLASTTEFLTAANVDYFGDPKEQHVAEKEIGGIKFAFINYNQFAPAPTDATTTVNQIVAARQIGEVPVVFTHWGEEYKPATKLEKRLAHRFIDFGAEIVIGTHPHVIQEHELYTSSTTPALGAKHIYYSLGNLIFDQYWEEKVRNGLMLQVDFGNPPAGGGVISVKEIQVELNKDIRTCQKEPDSAE